MKSRWFAIASVVLLVACSNGNAPAELAEPAAEVASGSDVAEVENPSGESLYSLIPGLNFGPSVVDDGSRVYTLESGETRRGFSLRYTDGDAPSAMESVQRAFTAAGYRATGEASIDASGQHKQNFAKRGQPTPFVGVSPPPSGATASPESPGKIWISWRLSEAEPRPDVDAAAGPQGETAGAGQ